MGSEPLTLTGGYRNRAQEQLKPAESTFVLEDRLGRKLTVSRLAQRAGSCADADPGLPGAVRAA